MKTRFTLLVLLIAFAFAGHAQQVPNSSFDNWTADPLSPDGWITFDAMFGMSFGLSERDTVDKIIGDASLKLTSDSIQAVPSYGVLPGLVSLGTGGLGGGGPEFSGIPFTYRPDTMALIFKYSSPGLDTALINLSFTKNGANVLAGGIRLNKYAQWVFLKIPLTSSYLNANTPDSLQIQFLSSGGLAPVKGSTLHIDSVWFIYINEPIHVAATATAAGATSFCQGGSVALNANTDAAFTYLWAKDGNPIATATTSSYTATASGSYTVIIDSAGTDGTSNAVVVTVHPNPTATLAGAPTACLDASALTLTGTPSGGTFSGAGVTGSSFNPATAGVGLHDLTYVFVDNNSCIDTATLTVTVSICSGVENVSNISFNIYPNPISTELNISSSVSLSGKSLEVFDVTGKLLLKNQLNGNLNTISVSTLASGSYTYRIADAKGNILKQNRFNVVK